ncbi:PREDICTED: RRP12-like protein [Lupinus angustifolius]|uniref:RRP12-like protein n=1 Tax=Lupinus angustifolius TaxID=3871 RepID=UPI00092ECB11|nr:PREDICTED: RRP12-like protein [Lupinus angustifolius]
MEEEHTESFNDASDLCHQLMDRYSNSSAPQHRHLLATAAALRSNLSSESLPLTPSAYFAAAISTIDSEALDATALAALVSFMAIDLPLLKPGDIAATKSRKAVEVVVKLLAREGEGLGVSSVRAAVKCLGVLIGFSDLEDWDSVELGFGTLLQFSIDKRPKVRRCAQESLEKVFRSLQSPNVIKEASKLVLSVLKSSIALAKKLTSSKTVDELKDDMISKNENLEVLHVLNVVNLAAAHLSTKVIPKVLLEVHKLFNSQNMALSRHILKTIEAILVASTVRNIVLEINDIVVSLASFVSLRDKNPLDTVILAATLLRLTMDLLYTGKSSLWIKNLPLVCKSVIGLLTFEGNTASQASSILNDLLKHHVGPQILSIGIDQTSHENSEISIECNAIKSTCAIFENALSVADGIPNEHVFSVISVLLIELGELSFAFMRNVVLKLADLMNQTYGGNGNNEHLRKCIGSAVFAMGAERFLTLVPISFNEEDYTYSNIWLVHILKRYVTGSSLAYYMEYIVPLAKSFKKASRKVKKSGISQDLLARAHELRGLLPSFCHHANDTYQIFSSLSIVLINFLRKDPSMHEDVYAALQILVNENKAALTPTKSESNICAVDDSSFHFSTQPSYSKEAATRNIKSMASCSNQLFHVLLDLFITSLPENRFSLKKAIGCLASITDSLVTKKVFLYLLKRFQFVDSEGDAEIPMSDSRVVDADPSDMDRDTQRCLVLEIASCLVEGAKDNLIEILYTLTIHSFKATNERVHHEAYHTLSKILEEQPCFSYTRYTELIDLLLSLKPPVDISFLRSRYTCFHTLVVHTVESSLEEEGDSKAFLILNEIILTLKDGNDEARKEAYDLLLNISSSLRDSSGGPTEPYHKLVSMIMGYLSGSSPHIKSGAVSALSVLVYKDSNLCLSVSDLVPSLLSLLQTKDVEIIKAVLGFVKVMVSSLQAKELHNFLSDVVAEILPSAMGSRHHFRSKVTIIFEILMRKCGSAAVKLVVPEKYNSFLKTVLENRRGKSSKSISDDAEDIPDNSSAKGPEWRKFKSSDSQEKDTGKHRKRDGEKNFGSGWASNEESRFAKRSRHSNDRNSNAGKSEGNSNKGNKRQYKSFNEGGDRKPKSTNTWKDKSASHVPVRGNKFSKSKGKFKRN